MYKDPLPYLVLLGMTTGIAAVTLVRLRRSGTPENDQYRVLHVLFAAVVVWNLAALLDGVGFSPTASYQFNKLTYLGIPTAATAWFAFALAYSDRGEFLTRRVVALLAVEPVLINVAVWTNDAHRLIWTLDWAATPTVITGHGPLFWVHAGYLYVITLGGVLLMADVISRRQRVFRIQSLALAVGAVVPLAANGVYLADYVAVDPTPPAFAISGLVYYWAIARTDLGSLTPIARQAVIDTMSAGMFVLDEDDRVVDVNRQGKRLLGVDLDEEVVGARIEDTLADGRDFVARFDGVVQGTETVAVDTGAGRRHYEIEVSPVTHDGERVGRLFLVDDVTERRERRRDLERKNEQLEGFASVVSHDLRNPLAVAEGYVEMIAEDADDPRIREYAREVEHSHERMETLIENVLSMARGGDTVDDPERVVVADVAREAWSTVDEGGTTLEITPAAESTRVLADPDRLQRAFENLFRNVRKHAGEDAAERSSANPRSSSTREDAVDPGSANARSKAQEDPTVVVGCETGDDSPFVDPGERTIYVADDGPGIPPSERDDVLQEGYTTRTAGTGFGLPIVQEIPEAHGWELAIEESEAGGAKVVFSGVEMPQDVAADGTST